MTVLSLASSNSILVRLRIAMALAIVAWLSCGRSAGQDDSEAAPTAESVLAQLLSPDTSEALRGVRNASEFAGHDPVIARTLLDMLGDERRKSVGGFVSIIIWMEAAYAFEPQSETGLEVLKQYVQNAPPPNNAERLIDYVLNRAPPDAELYAFIETYFQSIDGHLRCAAICASGNLAVDTADWLRDMRDLLGDSDVHVRGAVIDALMERPDQAASLLDRLIEMLYEPGDVYVAISSHASTTCPLRCRVAKLLCSMGMAARSALDDLRTVWAMDEDMEPRVWAAASIARMTNPPEAFSIEFLGQRLLREDGWSVWDLMEAASQLPADDPRWIAYIDRAARHAHQPVRSQLARLIFSLGLESHPGWCQALLSDKDPEVVADTLEEMIRQRYPFSGLATHLAAIATRSWPEKWDAYDRYRVTGLALEAIDSMGAQATVAKTILERWADEHGHDSSETAERIWEWLQRK